MKIQSITLIPDAQVQTQYERLAGFWHPYDLVQHKAGFMAGKSWGLTSKWSWRTRETLVCTAVTEQHINPITCPRLRFAYFLQKQQREPEVAVLYYHSQAWHACIYEHAILTRYLYHDDPMESTSGLFITWGLMVQGYPKASVLTILCTQLQMVQMMQTKYHNPAKHFSFSL